MEDSKDYLDLLNSFLTGSFRNTNGALYKDKYINPTSKVYLDPTSDSAGYQPVRNSNIYLNPSAGANRSQMGSLDTLFHEHTHVDQPTLAKLFNFTDPTYRIVNKLDFPYYDQGTSHPPAQETLATLRAQDAMSFAGENVWNSSMGEDVLDQMKKLGYPEDHAKQLLYSAMFPKLNFAGPVHPYQPPVQSSLADIYNQNNIVP